MSSTYTPRPPARASTNTGLALARVHAEAKRAGRPAPDTTELRDRMWREIHEERIAKLIAAAPPLDQTQRARLAALLQVSA